MCVCVRQRERERERGCILCAHLPTKGHLGRFHCLVIMDNAALNVCVQIPALAPAFNSSEYAPRAVMVMGCPALLGKVEDLF